MGIKIGKLPGPNTQAFLSLSQRLSPDMKEGGRIIAITSAGATRAIPDYAAVGASKAALEALVRHLALELAPRGITVNAICPGLVDTKALRAFQNKAQMLAWTEKRTPNGRLTAPKDVADTALFLAGPMAGMIQGQTIIVDGGYGIVG